MLSEFSLGEAAVGQCAGERRGGEVVAEDGEESVCAFPISAAEDGKGVERVAVGAGGGKGDLLTI